MRAPSWEQGLAAIDQFANHQIAYIRTLRSQRPANNARARRSRVPDCRRYGLVLRPPADAVPDGVASPISGSYRTRMDTPLPLNNRAHGIAVVALCVAFPLGFGALALVLGQDTNYDLRNYHWYNPYAFLTGRLALDIGPAHANTFYNPLLDVPVYLLAQALPAKAVGFLLGTVQGLNFVLLFALLRALIVAPSPAQRSGFAAVVAGVGVLGGGHLSLVGTTYYDNVVSLAVIGAALIVAASASTVFAGPMRSSFARTAAAGLVLGAGAGLKLPTAVFAVGFCAAFLVTAGSAGPPLRPRLRLRLRRPRRHGGLRRPLDVVPVDRIRQPAVPLFQRSLPLAHGLASELPRHAVHPAKPLGDAGLSGPLQLRSLPSG